MEQDQNQTMPWLQGGQFAPRSSVPRFDPPVSQQTPVTDPEQRVIPIPTGETPPMLPTNPLGTEAFMIDVLDSNIGRFVLVTAQLGTVQREFEGVITDVGRDFTTIVNSRLGLLVVLPTIFILFVTVPVAFVEPTQVPTVQPSQG